jgi:hypothetical protein
VVFCYSRKKIINGDLLLALMGSEKKEEESKQAEI